MNKQHKVLAHKYTYYRAFSGMWFVGAIWLYFYRIFITDGQVGLLDGMAFAIGLIAEVPSGALADKFGRDKLIRVGLVLSALGLAIQGFGSSFIPFFAGQTVLMIGISFVSGADESMFFDELGFDKESASWRKLVNKGTQSALIGSLFAVTVGGLIYNFNQRLPWILTATAFAISAYLVWSIKDTRIKQTRLQLSKEIRSYFIDIYSGFNYFRSIELRPYVLIIIVVQGLFYTTGWGLLRLVLLNRFHFSPFTGSLVVAVSSVVTVVLLRIIYNYTKFINEKLIIYAVSLSAAICLLISIPDIGYLGFIIIIALRAGEYILYPYMSEILNYHTPSDHRATVLSVSSFMRMLPYVILAPIIGMLNQFDRLEYFLVVWSVLIFLSLLYYRIFNNRNQLIPLTNRTS